MELFQDNIATDGNSNAKIKFGKDHKTLEILVFILSLGTSVDLGYTRHPM